MSPTPVYVTRTLNTSSRHIVCKFNLPRDALHVFVCCLALSRYETANKVSRCFATTIHHHQSPLMSSRRRLQPLRYKTDTDRFDSELSDRKRKKKTGDEELCPLRISSKCRIHASLSVILLTSADWLICLAQHSHWNMRWIYYAQAVWVIGV